MKIKTLIVFTLFALLMAVLIGCSQPPDETSNSTGETTVETTIAEVATIREPKYRFWIFDDERKEIEDAWYNCYGDELVWNSSNMTNLGVFNDYAVLMMIDESSNREHIISDITFSFYFEFQIYAYKNGVFHTLNEAFEKELLSADDIALIHESFTKHKKSLGGLCTAD